MSNSYYRYNCSVCNGTDLIWRGDIYWNNLEKKFGVAQLDSYTEAFCDDCDKEVKIKNNGDQPNDID
jgi:hypothetical protein